MENVLFWVWENTCDLVTSTLNHYGLNHYGLGSLRNNGRTPLFCVHIDSNCIKKGVAGRIVGG